MNPRDLFEQSYEEEDLKKVRERYFNTALKAIRQNCLNCSGWSAYEVNKCVIPECPLFEWRHGKTPPHKRHKMSEERRAEASMRMKKIRSKQEQQKKNPSGA